ncbi:MAG TPA: 2-oxoglutarate dehydrogenase E1 component [Rhodospirillales bacterium]|jgi:2-oxoglutarate dehydrogenase E1 component|nr:2-oxoglutarate dehydrogenase E1 component [Rhodospirillales bacterium]HIL75740.1 2-oxoglutarate dehydrogenase E1 component [Rhodospirillales bacterium]
MVESVDTIFTGINGAFISELYERYLENPNSVDPSWVNVFTDLDDDPLLIKSDIKGASWARSNTFIIGAGEPDQAVKHSNHVSSNVSSDQVNEIAKRSIRARILIRSYRVRGHLHAQFDPLGLVGAGYHKELDYKSYEFTEEDLDKEIYLDTITAMGGKKIATLRQILDTMRESYCSSIGVEYMHIQEMEERAWIQQNIEGVDYKSNYSPDLRRAIYKDLVEAEGFETYLQMKHTGTKRFGLDGGESLIPFMERVLRSAASVGVEEVVIGMPHRGRLNVLARTMGKPYVAIFSEFQGNSAHPEDVQGSGDVKYHLGASADRDFTEGLMHLSLTANPSHLECVNPVVLGKVRAKQAQRGDEARDKVMGLLMHGDAAFAGQGIVPESLDLSQIKGYRTGGTIHVVVNNQIGFTTNPSSSRSTPYPTDIAKGMQAPIFHVNGDDPEAVVRVADLAAQFRQKFKRDVIVDLFCYRRHGHNEGDEPMFTQPKMYTAIAKHPTTREIYRKKLIKEELITLEEIERVEATFRSHLDDEFEAAPNYKTNKADWLEGKWEGLSALEGEEEKRDDDTAVELGRLTEIGNSLARVPEEVNVNNKLIRQLKAKSIMMDTGEGIDWAMAEALAYGSLLMDGHPVRLSGQDSGRGTFSHRHAVITDQENENRYFPLSQINPSKQAPFEVMDSPLSEFAVLGYEYGYSLAEPETLTIWEAQFGDFANTAQVIFDQFIASGESKWLRMSGLVMLLPHGMEGQGPEHSSARLERFLQLCAEDNLQVVNITSPANFFHALRRQVKRNFRKPLIVMSPKSLLRHKLNISRLNEMGPGTGFCRIIPEIDTLQEDSEIKRVILCSGKVYFDLLEARRQQNIKDVVIIRVEQLYPWPRGSITEQISKYSNADVVWSQEEPSNQGSWHFVSDRLNYILNNLDQKTKRRRNVIYVGRRASASPATGALKIHNKEQAFLIDQALNGKESDIVQPYIPIK